MSVRVTIDVENATPKELEQIAGFMMALAGKLEEAEEVTEDKPAADPTPEKAFGGILENYKPESAKISETGPHLVIPPPPPAVAAAPPPPPPPIPNPASPTVPPSGGATLDKEGLPWDERIHASSRGLNADGTWRKKRGVTSDQVKSVEDQLRHIQSIPSPVTPPLPPTAEAAAPAADLMDGFVKLVGRTSAAIQAGKITQEQLQSICDRVGVQSMPLLGTRLDLVPTVAKLVDEIIGQ